MSEKDGVKEGTFAGLKDVEYQLDLADHYMRRSITITGRSSGVIKVWARLYLNNTFEEVVNGRIDLSKNRTIAISGQQINAIRFTTDSDGAFTAKVIQYQE